jgi:hypothetical protein
MRKHTMESGHFDQVPAYCEIPQSKSLRSLKDFDDYGSIVMSL